MTAQITHAVAWSEMVAANVRAEAARARVTQLQLAAALGINRVSVSDRWRGRTPWQLDELQGVAGVLGCDPAALLPRLDSNQQPSGYRPMRPALRLIQGAAA